MSTTATTTDRGPGLSTWGATLLVAEREITSQIRSKSFVISNLITIVLIIGGIVLANVVGGNGTDTTRVALGPGLPAGIAEIETFEVVEVTDRAEAEELVRSGDVAAAIVAAPESTLGYEVVGLDEAPGGVVSALAVAPDVVVLEPAETSDGLRAIIAIAFGLVFMMATIGSGSVILQNTITEKQSRIVEILLAAVPARALMAGKILGNSVIGIGTAVAMAASAAIGLVITGQTELLDMLTAPLVWFVIFFIFGFVLVASVFAGAAALVSRQEDAGTVMTPAMMLVMIPYFGVIFFGDNATVMTILSYVPFCAPVAMPVRMFLGEALWWEPLLSLGILVATTLLVVAIASRIYTGSLLRMGSRVKVREALRAS